MIWMRQKDFQRWLERRKQGVRAYVFRQGMLLYGLPMFVISSVITYREGQASWLPAVGLLLWLKGGALFGWLLWRVNEWRFQRVLRLVGRRRRDATVRTDDD